MYAQGVILDKLARFKAKYGWTPVEHSIEEIESAIAYMRSLEETGKDGARYFDDSKWTPKMVRFVQNERAMCAMNFEYYFTRYHHIAAENRIFRPTFRGGQRVLYKVIQDLEDRGQSIEIQLLKARQGGFCLDPETHVLLADMRWVKLDDVRPGDEIVAVDEFSGSGKGSARHITKGIVEAKRDTFQTAIRIGFEDGSYLIATPHHRLLGKKIESSSTTAWKMAKDFGIGHVVRYITSYPGDPSFEDGWIGGLIDGEGTLRTKPHSGAELTISQVNGPVLERARNYLIKNGYSFREDIDARRNSGNGSKLGNKNCHRLILSRLDEIIRLVSKVRPTRFQQSSLWWNGKELPGKRSGCGWRKIVSLEVLPAQRMIDLQTSVKTFIANGYVSHNSTMCEALVTHRALFVPGVKCAVGSANDQKTYVMMGMMYTALEHLPWWLPPRQTKDKRAQGGLLEFAHIGSQVVIQSGSMRGGIGQGTTPTVVHLSETCDYTNPVAQIEEGLLRAVHSGPEILMIFESTGNGNTGWWADQWRDNKEYYWQGKARLLPLFLPWFMTPELYPKQEWIQKFPIPDGWEPNPNTRSTVAKCETYARSSQALVRVIGDKWTMPKEQAWFWEFHYEEAKRKRTDKSWLRQMPCDDFDALIGENDSVFGWETIELITKNRKRSADVYGIVGEGIQEKHDPPPLEAKRGAEMIQARWQTPRETSMEWFLVPLKGDTESPSFDPLKKLIVYEHPQRGARYSVGIDTGTGVGGDRTIISVNRHGGDAMPDVQVAEFASDDISQVDIWAWAAAIIAYYTKFYPEGEQPKLIVEQVRKYGDSCYHSLKLHGFKNWHRFRQYDKKTVKMKESPYQREGWFTNAWSRPMLLGYFKSAVDNGWYEPHSRFLIGEIEAFEQTQTASGKTRADHRSGMHDDRIFAAAMSYFTLHDMDILAERSKMRYAKPEENELEVDFSPWAGPVIEPSEAERNFFAELGG